MKNKVIKDCQRLQYNEIKNWFRSLSNPDRWRLFIELYIDLKFLEYDDSTPCSDIIEFLHDSESLL